jgi:hypothetical protein
MVRPDLHQRRHRLVPEVGVGVLEHATQRPFGYLATGKAADDAECCLRVGAPGERGDLARVSSGQLSGT